MIKQSLGNQCLPRSQLIIWWGRCSMQIFSTKHCRVTFHPPPSGLGWGIICNKALWCGCEQMVIRQIKWVLYVHQLIPGHRIYSDRRHVGCISKASSWQQHLPTSPAPVPPTPTPRRNLCPPLILLHCFIPLYLILFNTNVTMHIFQAVFWLLREKKNPLGCLQWCLYMHVSSIYWLLFRVQHW